MNVSSVRRWFQSRRRVESLLSLYAVGLLFSSYYPLVLAVNGTRVLRPDWVLSVPLFAYVAHSIVTSDEPFPPHSRGSVFAAAVLAAFVVNAALNHLYVPFDAFTALGQLLYVVLLFCSVSYLEIDRRTLRTVFQIWVALMTVVGAYVLYQTVALNHGLPFWNPYFGYGADVTRAIFHSKGYNRPAGVFAEPRWLSGFYLPGIAFLLGALARDARLFWSRRADLAALGVVLLAFAFTGSMSGYLSLAALFAFGIILPWTRRETLTIGVAFYASMAVLVAVLSVFGSTFAAMIVARATKILDILLAVVPDFGGGGIPEGSGGLAPQNGSGASTTMPSDGTAPPSGSSSMSGSESTGSTGGIASHLSKGSIGIRAARVLTGIDAWFSDPLFGVGPGQFRHWAQAHNVTERFPVYFPSGLTELNNFWLQALVTGGLLGFTAVSAVWAEILNKLRHAFDHDLDNSKYLPACVLVLFVLFVDGFWGIGIVHPLRWFFPALVYSYVSGSEN